MKEPHIQTMFRVKTPVATGDFSQQGVVCEPVDGYHSLFAAQVKLRPFPEMDKHKLGWSAKDLMVEVLDRQRRFLATLHGFDPPIDCPNPHLRTVALRYTRHPGSPVLDIALVGKVFAVFEEKGEELARQWWQELAALIPFDYELLPATSEAEFKQISGAESLAATERPLQTAEVRRYEMFHPKPSDQEVTEGDYVVFPFAWHPQGLDAFWRAMALLPEFSCMTVTIRPTCLYEAESMHLATLYAAAKRLADGADPLLRLEGELSSGIYEDYIKGWQHPYLLRVHLVSTAQQLGILANALGTGLTCPFLNDRGAPGWGDYSNYEVVQPDQAEDKVCWNNHNLLELELWGLDQAARPYGRFRYLVGVGGAHCAFRLPFVPKNGIPDVEFVYGESVGGEDGDGNGENDGPPFVG